MTFWQIVSLIFIAIIFAFLVAIILTLRKELKKENELNEKRYQREQEWHDKEDENWRMVSPALQKRIAELEATNRGNQQVIGSLKYEIAKKNEFLDAWHLSDLYEQGFIPSKHDNKN